MGMIEAAYQLRSSADFYVASESLSAAPIPMDIFIRGGTIMFKTIPGITANTSAEELATNMARTAFYTIRDVYRQPTTISACRMANMDNMATKASTLARLIRAHMDTEWPILKDLGHAAVLQHYEMDGDLEITDADEYLDLYHFASLMQQRSGHEEIRMAATELMAAVDEYCVFKDKSSGPAEYKGKQYTWDHENSHGVSIFFPSPSSYRTFYTVAWLDFAAGTNWHGGALGATDAPTGTIEWGPMLAQLVQKVNPGAPDNPDPPKLMSPLVVLSQVYLPMVLRQ